MILDQQQLLLGSAGVNRLRERIVQGIQRGERSCGDDALGDPRSMLEDVGKRAREALLRHRVQGVEVARGGGSGHAVPGSIRQLRGAPAASHAAKIARSFGVISVMLPGGMAFDRTACNSISRAARAMCSASSKIIPLGGAGIPAHTGSLAWHMLQRVKTRLVTAANFGAGSAVEPASRGPSADSQAMAAMPAAATPQVHHGLPVPACRELKKCRMIGPSASRMATIN